MTKPGLSEPLDSPDIWNYFVEKERDLIGGSVIEEIEIEIAPDDQSGTLNGKASLRADTEVDAYLKVFERAALDEKGEVELVKYSYYLIVKGAETRGWDKDPTHEPPVHGLREALDLAWDEVQLWVETEPG